MAECVTLYSEFPLFGCIYLRASCMAECVTLYRECLGVSTWEAPAWRSALHCIASVWVYLPESLLHGGVCYTVSRVFGCIYLRASCMAECVTLYRECLGVSTWEPPAWRSVLHCIASVWVYLPESLLHGGVHVTLYSECLGVSTWEPPAWRSVLVYRECLGVSTWEPPAWRSACYTV